MPIQSDLEEALDSLPRKRANALQDWEMMTLEREECHALLYAEFKAADEKRSATDLKELIRADKRYLDKMIAEIRGHAQYEFLNEKLMATKKLADFSSSYRVV